MTRFDQRSFVAAVTSCPGGYEEAESLRSISDKNNNDNNDKNDNQRQQMPQSLSSTRKEALELD
jgi:hypothetical protein